MDCFDLADDKADSKDGSSLEPSGTRSHHGYHSSSNSNSSSVCSISSSSGDSERKASGAGDLDADADSFMCRQSGLSSTDQADGLKSGSKRPRPRTSESFGQASINPPGSEYGSLEINNSSITGVANEQMGSQWGWDDDDRGLTMDIQALLSEFGDFGDFFENEALPFGEPPGTTESQALLVSGPESGDVGTSPGTSMMDICDPVLLPGVFPPFDGFNSQPPPVVTEDSSSKNQEAAKNVSAPGQSNCTSLSSSGEFDHLIKAEALMTFAPEYGAVETLKSEISSTVFRSPYIPKSCKVDAASSSNNYVYSATPPSSPCIDGHDEKSVLAINMQVSSERQDANLFLKSKKYYTHVERAKERNNGKLSTCNNNISDEVGVASSQFPISNHTNVAKSLSNKSREGPSRLENSFSSSQTVLATEIDCLACQASMCRLRHTLLSSTTPLPASLSSSPIMPYGDSSIMVENMASKYEVRKKESIPVRIAGDIDVGSLDGPLNAPVGVWRSVGMPKVTKTGVASVEISQSLPHNSFIEESMLSYGLRQPLQELLDGMSLLVQQATSFVDVSLDADCGDGPYGWLAMQEQWRRGFSCGPSMVHAGCGGVLASCHSLDIAGVELVDPLSVDVQASLTISLLQSDIKAALKSAFTSVDGPLFVTDWCRGRAQPNETSDIFPAESTASATECRDSSSNLSVGEATSPSLSSAGGASSHKDGLRVNEAREKKTNTDASMSDPDQHSGSRLRPTLSVVPFPSILVGYQDDWLKTSPSSLQVWEKAPLEPYATPKNMSYYVVCPNIDPLTTAAADFFQQLGTVYETCKLGTHSPQILGNEMEVDSGKLSTSGFVLLDCPQSMKIDSSNASILGAISDYFLSLSNGWDPSSYLKTLAKVLKTLKLGSHLTAKEGNTGPCTVIYVVCPFPEPLAILQTITESSIAIGSVLRASDKERRSMVQNQVAKALSYSTAVDESLSNVLSLTGFNIPKLVLQIVTVDAIFRVATPNLNELIILKEIAFTVYNKARRISQGISNDTVLSSASGRPHSVFMQMTSPVPGMWKDYVGSRSVSSSLQRDGDLDASLRPGTWDNSWQTSRMGGAGIDPNRNVDPYSQDEIRCLFEPLFILAEPGSLERGLSGFPENVASEASKFLLDDSASSFMQNSASSGSGDATPISQPNPLDPDGLGSSHQKTLPSLQCCYGWTEDWRWLVCIWTDSRGELLDCQVYPFGGVSSRQDTKGLQSLFIQILQQGCQILQASAPDSGVTKPRDFVISRIGCFFELESQEWQKALYAIGGSELRKWSLQLRRSHPDGIPGSSNGNPLQQQEMSIMQERALPSSPSPLYGSHSKASTFMKGSMGQPSRKQLVGGHAMVDSSRGLLQWVQSISFVSVSVDHSLQLMFQADSSPPGPTQGSSNQGLSVYLEGYTPVKSLGSTSAAYILIPSPSMRFLPPAVLQLPTCLTAESPPLAHLLHSKGSAVPLSTGFVVSKAVPSMKKDFRAASKDEWPSVLSVSLVDYYGGNNVIQEKLVKGVKQVGRNFTSDVKDFEVEAHMILEGIAAELHALSWMTVSPAYLERRSALPFHCDMILRLRRLLHFADKELSQLPEKTQA